MALLSLVNLERASHGMLRKAGYYQAIWQSGFWRDCNSIRPQPWSVNICKRVTESYWRDMLDLYVEHWSLQMTETSKCLIEVLWTNHLLVEVVSFQIYRERCWKVVVLSKFLLKMSLKSKIMHISSKWLAKGSNRLKGAINVSENMYWTEGAMSDKASNLEMGSFTETIHLKERV
jgi:hypothetical protein